MRKRPTERCVQSSYEYSKGKKSQSLLRNKVKVTNTMMDSLKKTKLFCNSKSNKKTQNQLSNKSLKPLSELNKNIVVQKTTSKIGKENEVKKGSANIKSLKQKVVGVNQQYVIARNETPALRDYEKFKKGAKVQVQQLKTDGSLLNFSCILGSRQPISLKMFQLGRRLGKGRFGDVVMARDKITGFALAMKILNKKQIKEAQMEAQILQQIKIQTYANHPNILKMYGCFSDAKKIYLLLELATNGCLFKEIRAKESLQENQAANHLKQVVNGVRYLHSLNVIHRDIKPQNILNSFSVLKLCDFGWAIYSPLYQRQTFCGTLDYVSPQIVVGDYYDEKVDVWCIGVLCYELCTGRAPFESKTNENQTYNRILKVDIVFPNHFSLLLIHLISHLLHREPNNRMTLAQVESHQWMKKYEQSGSRFIQKQIWDAWLCILNQN